MYLNYILARGYFRIVSMMSTTGRQAGGNDNHQLGKQAILLTSGEYLFNAF